MYFLVELFCLIFSFETFSYNSSWQKSLFKHLNEWKISMFYNHEILMFKDCWEKKFSIENILESVRPAEKGKRSTYKEESKMKTTKFMFICGIVNAVRRYSKEFPTIINSWIIGWKIYCFIEYDLNGFFDIFYFVQICLFQCIFVVFFTKNLKLLYYKFFYKHHSKSTSGSCESQFTLYSLYLITCNHNWNKSKLLTTITCY